MFDCGSVLKDLLLFGHVEKKTVIVRPSKMVLLTPECFSFFKQFLKGEKPFKLHFLSPDSKYCAF